MIIHESARNPGKDCPCCKGDCDGTDLDLCDGCWDAWLLETWPHPDVHEPSRWQSEMWEHRGRENDDPCEHACALGIGDATLNMWKCTSCDEEFEAGR